LTAVDSNAFAKLQVNGGYKGEFIGCGVEISGGYSDTFFPTWISSNNLYIGATELHPHIFDNQNSRQNSSDFRRIESVSILRGDHSDLAKNQAVNIYVDVQEDQPEPEPEPEPEPAPEPEPEPETTLESPCDSYGDINDDGRITVRDAELILEIVTGKLIPTTEQKKRGDLNGDGRIGSGDSIIISRYLEGSADTFPICRAEESPVLYQVGLSAGYSSTEPIDDGGQVGKDPNKIPGWLKGGLLKTGSDLIVLIVTTILIVVALIYLISLLKEGDDLARRDQTAQRPVQQKNSQKER
jgi:hypothetical protein